jgi:branched-chain amino acid transport system permease protein
LASALGGVAGTVYVMEIGIASPDDFTQLLAINFIVGLVLGGVGTLSGAVIGGLAITLIPDWSSSTTSVAFVPERWLQGPTGTLFLGISLIAITFFLPGGIIAGIRRLWFRVVRITPPLVASAAASSTDRPPVLVDVQAPLGAPSTLRGDQLVEEP